MLDSSLSVVSSDGELGDGGGVGLAFVFEVGVVAELVGDLGQLEQLADRAAGVEVVVHRGEEFLAAGGGGVGARDRSAAAEASSPASRVVAGLRA